MGRVSREEGEDCLTPPKNLFTGIYLNKSSRKGFAHPHSAQRRTAPIPGGISGSTTSLCLSISKNAGETPKLERLMCQNRRGAAEITEGPAVRESKPL